MSQDTSNDSASDMRYDAERSISLVDADVQNPGIEGVRSKVSLTREAAPSKQSEKVLDSWVL